MQPCEQTQTKDLTDPKMFNVILHVKNVYLDLIMYKATILYFLSNQLNDRLRLT